MTEQFNKGYDLGTITLRSKSDKRGGFKPKNEPIWLSLCNKMDDSEKTYQEIRGFAENAGIDVIGKTRTQLCKELALFFEEKLEIEESSNIYDQSLRENLFSRRSPSPKKIPSGGGTLEDLLKEKKVGGYSEDWNKPPPSKHKDEYDKNVQQYKSCEEEYYIGQKDGYGLCSEDYSKSYMEGVNEAYYEGKKDGYSYADTAYEQGQKDGYNICTDECSNTIPTIANQYEQWGYYGGYEKGYGEGYEKGYGEGYEKGYGEGGNMGYYEGYKKGYYSDCNNPDNTSTSAQESAPAGTTVPVPSVVPLPTVAPVGTG